MTALRSLLFVPGDDPRKIEKALQCGADAVILDLEDAVAPDRKEEARAVTAAALGAQRGRDGPLLMVRVNPLGSGLTEGDLDAVAPWAPAAIVLPKAEGGASVALLSAKLAVREAEHELPEGAIGIIAIATETPRALFAMGTYGGASRRLRGLTWGGEDLGAALGAETNRLTDGTYADPYRLARALTLVAAAASDVPAIDSVFTGFRDPEGLRAEAEAGRRDGFSAKLAIHPAQVPIIHEVFTPTPEVVADAMAVIAAFDAAPGAGVVSVAGRMLDRPHRVQAERVLARARAAGIPV